MVDDRELEVNHTITDDTVVVVVGIYLSNCITTVSSLMRAPGKKAR